MKNAPEGTYLDPIVGWRFWRVQRIETLSSGSRYRLCAAGTNGRPKVWQPQQANVAVCSVWAKRHEAPHPNHECGIYAYKNTPDAESHLARMEAYDQSGDPMPTSDAWAIGKVSLWGRVIECEKGWRAQFAYPYEIKVFTGRGSVVAALASDYAVDIEAAPRSGVKAILKRFPDVVRDAQEDAVYRKWYATTIYGHMDSSFLKPYHEAVMARFDAIETTLLGLQEGRKDA